MTTIKDIYNFPGGTPLLKRYHVVFYDLSICVQKLLLEASTLQSLVAISLSMAIRQWRYRFFKLSCGFKDGILSQYVTTLQILMPIAIVYGEI